MKRDPAPALSWGLSQSTDDLNVLESPHPSVVRETRIKAGISVDACIEAAEFKTRASWYQVELGKNQLPAWRWKKVLQAIASGDYKRSRRPVAKADFVPSEIDPLLWVDDDKRVAIGGALKSLREKLHWSASDMASTARVDYTTLEDMESGTSKSHLTSKRLRILVAALRVRKADMVKAMAEMKRAGKVDGVLLRGVRETLGVSQQQVGEWIGFAGARKGVMVSAYERGEYAIPEHAERAFRDGANALVDAAKSDAGWRLLEGEIGLA